MKKIISLWAALFAFFAVSSFVSAAQDSLNAFADGILGDYEVSHQGECSKVRITKENDGTYTVRVFWVQDRLDKKGNVRLDDKNPDKSMRNVECDNIVIVTGLKYDAEKQKWGDAKIYDPTRGIKANVVCEFRPAARKRLSARLFPVRLLEKIAVRIKKVAKTFAELKFCSTFAIPIQADVAKW